MTADRFGSRGQGSQDVFRTLDIAFAIAVTKKKHAERRNTLRVDGESSGRGTSAIGPLAQGAIGERLVGLNYGITRIELLSASDRSKRACPATLAPVNEATH